MPIKSYGDLKEKQQKLSFLLMDLSVVIDKLNELGLAVNGSALLDLKNKLNNSFKVLVIGEFKNGKSTFINSLMGEKILPAYSTPCTAVINEVVYSRQKKATLYFKNPLPKVISTDISPNALQHLKDFEGKEVPPMQLDIADLEDYVAIPDPVKDQADSIKESPYSVVRLEYPIDLCRDGIEIIDSPGLNEDAARTKVTEEYLNQADAILFVFRCPKIAGTTEMEYITNQIHVRGYRDIFFICNAINQVPEDEQERLIRYGNKKLLPLTDLGESGIFYVNALGALEAKQAGNAAALLKTGIPEFEAALSEYLRNNKGRTKLMQIITPCSSYIDALQSQHIKSYISSLDQNIESVEKKIRAAMPKLDLAVKRKDLVEKKIDLAIQELQNKVQELMDIQFGVIINKIPKFVEDMDIDNHMTVNPFKQKSKKEALEKEVISKMERFVRNEMGYWIQTELTECVESFVDNFLDEIGEDINLFYDNLDEFRFEVSGIKKPKNISGFSRVSATILGTIAGGPTYGALGASLGFGEITKRSGIAIGVQAVLLAIYAFTPMGEATLLTIAAAALASSGVLQMFNGGKALTDKYKKQLKISFIESLEKGREESCRKYAESISDDVKEKFELVNEALENEIGIERSKVEALKTDREKSEGERISKLYHLRQLESKLQEISESLAEMEDSIN